MKPGLRHTIVLAALALAGPAAAAPFECRWTPEKMRLDGKATEAAWEDAQLVDGFRLPWLKEPRDALTATRARLLWDADYLYFFAEMDDVDLFANVTERDGMTWKDDVFELFFKPSKNEPGYYEFQVNARGTLLDMFLPDAKERDRYEKHKSDIKFRFAARVVRRGTLNKPKDDDEGWSVEGRIPWSDFAPTGGGPEPGDTWTFALCRYDYSRDMPTKRGFDISTCAPLETGDFHEVESYAPLLFVGPPDPAAGLPARLRAVGGVDTARFRGSPDPPPLFRAEPWLPDFPITRLITFIFEPGNESILYVDQPVGDKAARLNRYHLGTGESEILFDPDEIIYSIAFHPRFEKNGYVFLGHMGPASLPREERRAGVTRYSMKQNGKGPRAFDPESATPIIHWPSFGHSGAALAFGSDGTLFVTSGDGTSDSDENLTGQGLDHLLAKVLRIDVDRPEGDRPYSIPEDNPFLDRPGARPETWAYGFRNPWRAFWDEKLERLWVGNNGQDLFEQVYLVEPGANYGWSIYEGSHPFYLERERGPDPISFPVLEHGHHESRSLTGGIVYRGDRHPAIKDAYIYGDNSTGKIWAAKHDGKKVTWHREIIDTTFGLTDFRESPAGELLVADYQGRGEGGIYRLVPYEAPGDAPPFPTTLRETGFFDPVRGHRVREALIPYDVIIPEWADGAHSERYLALPEEEFRMGIGSYRGWNLPDGAVVIQSFAQPGEEPPRRWIETRLMTRRQGEWAFYTYAWNEKGTDAALVEAEGRDRELSNGMKWRYPSRAECGMCHSRSANFLLGLQTPQMNRPLPAALLGKKRKNAPGINQLEAFDRLRLFHQRRGTSPSRSSMRPPKAGYAALAAPGDESAPVEERARAWLHATCSHCHVRSGGGNATMILNLRTPTETMEVINDLPKHGFQGLGEDARIIVPGDPGKSILLRRIILTEAGGMPPFRKNSPDPRGVDLILKWIEELGETAAAAPSETARAD